MKKKILAMLLCLSMAMQMTNFVGADEEYVEDILSNEIVVEEAPAEEADEEEIVIDEIIEEEEIILEIDESESKTLGSSGMSVYDELFEKVQAITASVLDGMTEDELNELDEVANELYYEIDAAYDMLTEEQYAELIGKVEMFLLAIWDAVPAEGGESGTFDVTGSFSSEQEYRDYRYVSAKDGGVRENEVKLTEAEGQTIDGIPVKTGEISYEYADVIVGMNPASNMEIKVPESIIALDNSRISGYGDCGKNSDYSDVDTCVNASEKNHSMICDDDQYYVIYKDIGTYAEKENINLKVSVVDYELTNDESVWENTNYVPLITLRLSKGLPGVEVAYVSWVKLKYEFINDEGNPITVGGNTTYYDVDGSQLVHLNADESDNSCKGIYVTESCHLYAGTFESSNVAYSMNGVGVFERVNQGYPTSQYTADALGVVVQAAFTEVFKASTMYRTFSFIQNRVCSETAEKDYMKKADIMIDESERYHSDEWGGGLIFHSGVPVERRTGNLTISKVVPEDCGNQSQDFSFKIILNEELSGSFGEVNFHKGVAEFTLSSGEAVTATGLYEFLSYEIIESNNENYKVYVNDEEIVESYSGSLVFDETTINTGVIIEFKNVYCLADLRITKDIDDNTFDSNQTFVFIINGNDENTNEVKDLYVVIKGEGSVTIADLPVGQYTIEEDKNWCGRYHPTDNDYEQTANVRVVGENEPPVTVTFINESKTDQWLDGNAIETNKFNG